MSVRRGGKILSLDVIAIRQDAIFSNIRALKDKLAKMPPAPIK